MKSNLLLSISWLVTLFQVVTANVAKFDHDNSQVCSGVYSKHDWGGSLKPHLAIRLDEFDKYVYKPNLKHDNQPHSDDIKVSFVVFEYADMGSIGAEVGDGHHKYICDDVAINDLKVCSEGQRGNFILNKTPANNTILTGQMTHLGQTLLNYNINSTGYYCLATYIHERDDKTTTNYRGKITFQNAFGELSASEIPKLPAYGILTLCYAIALALFGFQFFMKRKENQILPLQRYLLAMLAFLTFETFVVWSYYDLVNRSKNPSSHFVVFYMFFLSILNSAKITFSFFLLLCISLGYGVVVLKLNKKVMFRCKLLAGAQFLASLFYLLGTYHNSTANSTQYSSDIETSDQNVLLGMVPLIPISITVTIYYIAIMISIRQTTASLHQQRQIIKLQLYQNLFRMMFLSLFLTFAALFFSSFFFLGMTNTQMVEANWKGAYFLFEFWPSVVFFFVFMGIAWLWRPTETSYMLTISQQLSTGDDIGDGEEGGAQGYHQGTEFELDDLSLMSHSDHEDDDRNIDHDSFELSRENQQTSFPQPPPAYEPVNEKQKETPEPSHTLFEVGEGDDDEIDETDKRRTD